MTTLYYRETETIKRIQFNTQTTQYTQPASCSDSPYITIPTDPASLTTVTNTRTIYDGDLIQISRTSWFTMDPNCYHTGFDKTVFLDREARTSSYADQYRSITPSLCPRQYTLARLWTRQPNADATKRTTVEPNRWETVQYTSDGDEDEELWGVCCPYDEAIFNNFDGTSGFWFNSETLECVGNTKDMGGDRISALPFYITWNQWDGPIATSYDSKQKNFEFAHYTRWPIGTGSIGRWDVATRIGFVPAAVITNDPDPSNTSGATATSASSSSSGSSGNGKGEGVIIGVIFGTIVACVAILGGIVFCCRRGRRARLTPNPEAPLSVSQPHSLSTNAPTTAPSAISALRPGQRFRLANERARQARAPDAQLNANPPRRGTVELAELDPPPVYRRNPGTGELPLERVASESSNGGLNEMVSERSSMVGSDVALVGGGSGSGGASSAAGTGAAGDGNGGEFLTVPGQQSTTPVVPQGEAPPYTVLRG